MKRSIYFKILAFEEMNLLILMLRCSNIWCTLPSQVSVVLGWWLSQIGAGPSSQAKSNSVIAVQPGRLRQECMLYTRPLWFHHMVSDIFTKRQTTSASEFAYLTKIKKIIIKYLADSNKMFANHRKYCIIYHQLVICTSEVWVYQEKLSNTSLNYFYERSRLIINKS